MANDPDTPKMGDNSGAVPIPERLATTYAEKLARLETTAGKANNLPATIDSDRVLADVGDVVSDVNKLWREMEDDRVAEGAPYLSGQREVNGWFKLPQDRLSRIKVALTKRADDYQAAKAAEARRKANADAQKLRDEQARMLEKADKAEAAGQKGVATRAQDKAYDAGEKARLAEAESSARASELTKVRTAGGTTVSAKTETDFKIVDYDAIPLNMLRPYLKREEVEKAIRALVRVQKMATVIPGVEVFEKVQAAFR